MLSEGWSIVRSTLECLERCTSLKSFKQIHARTILDGFQQDNYVGVNLISFCSKTVGNIGYARMIFDGLINSANVFLWTAMISSYASYESEPTREAIALFKLMRREGPLPNHFTLSSVLKACSFLKAIREGIQVHALVIKLGFGFSVYVQTTMLDFYAKAGCLEDARWLFGAISDGNIVACNTMIACHARAGDMEAAQCVFDRMSQRDSISWAVMISGYANCGNMLVARDVFNEMPVRDVHSWNALIAGYLHSGEWHDAIRLLDEMHLENVKANHMTLAMVISACGELGALKLARKIHGFSQKHGIEVNVYVLNSLVDMYAKCGRVHEAYAVFSEISVKDVVSYNVMVAGFANHGYGEDALKLLPQMLESGIRPDTVTFLGILSACSRSGLVNAGRRYFESMSRDYGIDPSVDHYACMVDLLGRAGFIEEAHDLGKTMSINPHAGVWGALLNACRTYRDIRVGKIAARELFKLEPENPGNYVLLSNIYATASLWDSVEEVRCLMRGRGVVKTAGCSWIEVDNGVQEFLMGDATHPLVSEIYAVLRHLCLQVQCKA